MMEWLEDLPQLIGVRQEEIRLASPIEAVARSFSKEEGTILLLSGSDQDCAQYHILGLRPWLSLKGRPGNLRLRVFGKNIRLDADPFAVLDGLLSCIRLPDFQTGLPLAAGLMGYLSYDLKDCIEDLPRTCMDSGLPDICLYAPSVVVVQEKVTKRTVCCTPVWADIPSGSDAVKSELLQAGTGSKNTRSGEFCVDSRGLVSCLTKDEYLRAVENIIAYLKAGDIYQANFSQQFHTGFSGDPFGLFLELYHRNPAPFFAYINAGDHWIVSTSPERFLRQKGTRVETRPIKGTIARGDTQEQDRLNQKILSASIKDDAELTMIVDLMRNDLSRVTEHGSVMVSEHKRLEPYDNVFHLVSVVHGSLSRDKNSVDLIRATFPGGSITGCPKIRSMEIIDELEPVKRHVYTGSIGYISFHDTMDLSIAIRTATIHGHRISFSVGGGIVFDSDPEKEFQETLDKGRTLMEALAQASADRQKTDPHRQNAHSLSPPRAWINGKMVDQDRAVTPADTNGFQYGAGIFETVRVAFGQPVRLSSHIRRMSRSWQALFGRPLPDISWAQVVALLIRENNLGHTVAAVKLMVSQGKGGQDFQVCLAGFARPYVHRLELLDKDGLDVAAYPHVRQTPLASHKTMNYLYYERAGAWARENNGDEALILNPDQTVSETNTGNILIKQGQTIVLPASAHVLPGIAQKAAASALAQEGCRVVERPVPFSEFVRCTDILVTNSLMGAVKVLGVNGTRIRHSPGFCESVNRVLALKNEPEMGEYGCAGSNP